MKFNWKNLLTPYREHTSKHEKDINTKISNNDKRSEFQKDFDTICNSSSIRRLQSKAQVFPLERGDFCRTRLTHSIETMAIAESMGHSVIDVIRCKEKLDNETERYIMEIPTILKSAALIHDIGNPPFGHISEGIISKWFEDNLSKMYYKGNKLVIDDRFHDKRDSLDVILSNEQKNDLINFDGNAQTLRIITHLQNPILNKGMNLTYPVMATIIKYPCVPRTNKDANNNIQKKKDYFLEEEHIYVDIQEKLGLNNLRHPLVYLLEASDDIAYLTADIEDAVRKGLITLADLKSKLKSMNNDEELGRDLIKYALECINDYEKTLNRKNHNKISSEHDTILIMRQFRAQIKGKMISEVINAFSNKYYEIMNGSYKGELLREDNLFSLRLVFSELLNEKVYYSTEIVKLKIESCKIISNLLGNYILSIFNYNVQYNGYSDDEASLIYNTLSQDYRNVCNKSINKFMNSMKGNKSLKNDEKQNRIKSAITYYKLLLAVDNISGMTDTYAYDIYRMINAIV